MILYKKILSQYQGSMSGPPEQPGNDIIYTVLDQLPEQTEDMESFRRHILGVMAEAKPLDLDTEIMECLDKIAQTMTKEHVWLDFMRDVCIPEGVVWIEGDCLALAKAQFENGTRDSHDEIKNFGLRGLLMDNRASEHLAVWLFRSTNVSGEGLIDPLTEHVFPKNSEGLPILEHEYSGKVRHVWNFMNATGLLYSHKAALDILESENQDFTNFFTLAGILFDALHRGDNDFLSIPADFVFPQDHK